MTRENAFTLSQVRGLEIQTRTLPLVQYPRRDRFQTQLTSVKALDDPKPDVSEIAPDRLHQVICIVSVMLNRLAGMMVKACRDRSLAS